MLLHRSMAYSKLGQMELAIKDCKVVVDLFPKNRDYLARLDALTSRKKNLFDAARLNLVRDQRAYHMSETGLYTRIDYEKLFQDHCDTIRSEKEIFQHNEHKSTLEGQTKRAALLDAIKAQIFSIHTRLEMDKEEQDQKARDKEIAIASAIRAKEAIREVAEVEKMFAADQESLLSMEKWRQQELESLRAARVKEKNAKKAMENDHRSSRRGGRRGQQAMSTTRRAGGKPRGKN